MKILLDENLPKKLKFRFSSTFQVFTINDMGWNAKKNGELLSLLEKNQFNVLITSDKNLEFQQNLQKFKVIIVVINTKDNRYESVLPFVSQIEEHLSGKITGRIIRI